MQKEISMDDRAELYWRMYQENCTQGRHHETQRAAVTTVLVSSDRYFRCHRNALTVRTVRDAYA
jgi:hypothetical protein